VKAGNKYLQRSNKLEAVLQKLLRSKTKNAASGNRDMFLEVSACSENTKISKALFL
jgi:hypothetical protein